MLSLTEQVSQLARLDGNTLRAIQEEVLLIDEPWTNVYSDYHTGGWQTLSLLNNTSRPNDTVISDCEPVETSLLLKMPNIRAALRNLGLRYMWVRLARLEPDSFMLEHRDYQELKNVRRLRLHIPVTSNPYASIVIDRVRVHLAVGYLWKLNPLHRHAASNFGKEPRVHIILDCYADEALDALMRAETLDPICVYGLPLPPSAALADAVRAAERLARVGDFRSAEHQLLRMYHEYNLEEGHAYELVSRMYSSLGDDSKSELWMSNKLRFLQPQEAVAARD